jgi:hypothetical protein
MLLKAESSREDGGPSLSWYDVQRVLENALFDVLLLLDCGHSVGPNENGLWGTMEVLAGSSQEIKATGPEADSVFGSPFTHVLTKHLREQALQPHELLITELQAVLSLDKILEDQSPIHGVLKSHGSPITLRPFPSEEEEEEAMARRYRRARGNHYISSITFRRERYPKPVPVKSELKALVSVSFRGDAAPNIDNFVQLSSTQSKGGVSKIEIQALNIGTALDCRSSIVLFSMPVSVWAHLEDLPGCSLVGFVKTWSL